MYAPQGLRPVRKKSPANYPFRAFSSLPACFDSAYTITFSCSDFPLNLSRFSSFSRSELRKTESDIMRARGGGMKEQDVAWLDLMSSDGRCFGCDASACCLSSSSVFFFFSQCAGRKWLFYSDPCFMRHANAFSSVHCFSHNAITIFPSHGSAADHSLQGDGSRSIRMHE